MSSLYFSAHGYTPIVFLPISTLEVSSSYAEVNIKFQKSSIFFEHYFFTGFATQHMFHIPGAVRSNMLHDTMHYILQPLSSTSRWSSDAVILKPLYCKDATVGKEMSPAKHGWSRIWWLTEKNNIAVKISANFAKNNINLLGSDCFSQSPVLQKCAKHFFL